jgi:threonine/homoserine/homoserine lactone efflux protein
MGSFTEKLGEKGRKSYLSTLLLWILFAMDFCPYSGVLYFVMLIPMTVASAEGLYLPLIIAIATGIPVIIFAWLLAYAVGNIGKVYSSLKSFELWFRRVVASLFIGVGIWYIFSVWY